MPRSLRRFSSRRGSDSPLSHCLSLCWFRSHVVVLGVGPQVGQATVFPVFVYFCGSSISIFRGGEAGARLASRGRGRRVPLLAVSGGGLVAVVVTVFPHDVSKCYPLPFLGYSLAVSSLYGHRWSGLVWTCASSGFRLVSSRFCSPVLGCQSVVALACVGSRPRGVSGVWGGSVFRSSTLWRSEVAVLEGSFLFSKFLLLWPVRDW
ncbi:hypothetical protein Taro_013572 [Colocasia esculenta]|uniref:Uncharacterized protein n=1 Tax=Colocasia esculenta TaxID=4460 RepID=A0A843UC90_COLES|nr:hypothetical protein [Colocasia esculenta]